MGYICSRCNQVVHGGTRSLIWHLKNRHALLAGRMFISPVSCGQHGCYQTFRYSASLKKHLEKYHAQNQGVANPVDDFGDLIDDPDIDNENLDASEDDNIPPCNNAIFTTKDDVIKLAASCRAKLKASSSVVQSTVDQVVSETSALFSDVVQKQRNCWKEKVLMKMMMKD